MYIYGFSPIQCVFFMKFPCCSENWIFSRKEKNNCPAVVSAIFFLSHVVLHQTGRTQQKWCRSLSWKDFRPIYWINRLEVCVNVLAIKAWLAHPDNVVGSQSTPACIQTSLTRASIKEVGWIKTGLFLTHKETERHNSRKLLDTESTFNFNKSIIKKKKLCL